MTRNLGIGLALFVLIVGCADARDVASGPGIADITPDAFLANPPAGALVLDVRSAEEYGSGHVPGAVNIPHTEIASRMSELPSDHGKPIVVYCERGGRAGIAGEALLAAGYTQVLHLAGDMSEWRAQQRPTERP